MVRLGAQRTLTGFWRARVHLLLCAGVLSSCGVPSFNVRQVSAGGGSDPDAASGTGESEQPPQDDAGRGGHEARAGRGARAGEGGVGGRSGGGVSGRKADAGKGGVAASEGGARAGQSGAGAGGDTHASAGAGGDGDGGSAGMPAADGGAGGNGGAAAGGGGRPATDDAPCRTWRTDQDETSPYDDLGPAPGNETNSQASVSQWICRAAAPGGASALGKFVPGFGCYGTYASGNTRIGFGATKQTGGFAVLLPNSQCPLAWAAPGSGALDLGDALHVCRGRLQNEMYPGGMASGTELGQWLDVGGSLQCWTQFHDANGNMDDGSRRLTQNVEVLIRAQ